MEAHVWLAAASAALGVSLLAVAVTREGVTQRAVRKELRAGTPGPHSAGERLVFPPSITYETGLFFVLCAAGLWSSFAFGLVFAVLAGAAVARIHVRGGVTLDGDDLVVGSTERTEVIVPLVLVGSVHLRPRSAIGPSLGAWWLADVEGEWMAAIRYHGVVGGARSAQAIIDRCEMHPVDDGQSHVWMRPDARLPARPAPVFGGV